MIKMNKAEDRILHLLLVSNMACTAKEVEERTKLSERTVRRSLNSLVLKNAVYKEGFPSRFSASKTGDVLDRLNGSKRIFGGSKKATLAEWLVALGNSTTLKDLTISVLNFPTLLSKMYLLALSIDGNEDYSSKLEKEAELSAIKTDILVLARTMTNLSALLQQMADANELWSLEEINSIMTTFMSQEEINEVRRQASLIVQRK